MERIILHGRKVMGGVVEGEALVTRETISGWGGIDVQTGVIIDLRHELAGASFAGKVLIFRGAKGSSGWSSQFHQARNNGVAPLAMVFNETTTKAALGCVVTRCPGLTALDEDPTEIVRSGDWVRVDGDAGTLEILRRKA